MEKLKSKLIKNWPEFLIVLLTALVYAPWLNPAKYLVAGDWAFHYRELLRGFLTVPKMWESFASLGQVDIIPSYDPLKPIYGFFAQFFDYNVLERLVYFWPALIFSVVGILLLGRKIFGNNNVAKFFLAMLFLFNTYILAIHTSFITYAVAYGLTPIILMALIDLMEENKISLRRAVIFSLWFFLAYVYEARAGIAFTYFIGLYVLFILATHLRRAHIHFGNIVLGYAIFGALAAFSVVPLHYLFGQIASTVNLFVPYNTLADTLGLHSYAWQGNIFLPFKLIPFHQVSASWYFYIITGVLFIPILMQDDQKKKAGAYFFTAASLIGIFLLKQQNAPIGDIYRWAFFHLPTFNLFRESNKFIIFMLPISILFAMGMAIINQRLPRKYSYAAMALISLVICLNLKPLLTHEIATLFVQRTIPTEYQSLKSLISNDQNFSRSIWIPSTSQWTLYTSKHPSIGFGGLVSNTWVNFFDDSTVDKRLSEKTKVQSAIQQPVLSYLLNSASIKYLVIPMTDDKNNEYPYTTVSQKFFTSVLDGYSWLRRLDAGTGDVAVYENLHVTQYISALTRIYSLDTLNDIQRKVAFASAELGGSFGFTPKDGAKSKERLVDAFEAVNKEDISANGDVTLPINGTNKTLYADESKPQVTYVVKDNILKVTNSFIRLSQSLDANPVVGHSAPQTVLTANLSSDEQYGLDVSGKLYQLKITNSNERNLGTLDNSVKLLRIDKSNRASENQLASIASTKKVSDCNNYDGDPGVSMTDIEDTTLKKTVMELRADKHIACASTSKMAVKPGEKIGLSFSYKVVLGREAIYEVEFNDDKAAVPTPLPVSDPSWNTLNRTIEVPQGATSMKITFEASPSDQAPVTGVTRYSDLRVSSLTQLAETPVISGRFTPMKISDEANKITYSGESKSFLNLIPNPSLEMGSWQNKVGDCNGYDNRPILNMELDKKNKTDGNQSLALEATRHVACTGPGSIEVSEGDAYLLSFDYQGLGAANAGYSISLNDPDHTQINERNLPNTLPGWNKFTKIIQIPYGATRLSLTVFAYADEANSGSKMVTKYDNFALVKVPDVTGKTYLVNNSAQTLIVPKTISFDNHDPVLKKIHIHGATTPFYIAMAETYHPGWRLEINNNKITKPGSWLPWRRADIASTDHYQLNNYENGWYVDLAKVCSQEGGCTKNDDGSYDLELAAEFVPQRTFYIAMIFSSIALLACISYLIFCKRRTKKVETIHK